MQAIINAQGLPVKGEPARMQIAFVSWGSGVWQLAAKCDHKHLLPSLTCDLFLFVWFDTHRNLKFSHWAKVSHVRENMYAMCARLMVIIDGCQNVLYSAINRKLS